MKRLTNEELEEAYSRGSFQFEENGFYRNSHIEGLKRVQKELIEKNKGRSPFGFVSEWNGDESDIGLYHFVGSAEDIDEEHNWIPVYTTPQPDRVAALKAKVKMLSETIENEMEDSLLGAAKWLVEAIKDCTVEDIRERLLIGFNRAQRLYENVKKN